MFSCPQCSDADEVDAVNSTASYHFCWWSNVIFGICSFSEINIHAFECASPRLWGSPPSLWHVLRGRRSACVLLAWARVEHSSVRDKEVPGHVMGDIHVGHTTVKPFPPISRPLLWLLGLSTLLLSTSFRMGSLEKWFKATKNDRRYHFCTLKHDDMFQTHILI